MSPRTTRSTAGAPLTAASARRPAKAAAKPSLAAAKGKAAPNPARGRRPLDADAKALLATLRAREAELEAKLATAPELPEISAGGDDVHLVAEALVVDNAQKSFAMRQLADTRAAISAIAKGKHGICLSCREPIPPARLEILPDATQCVPCASGKRR